MSATVHRLDVRPAPRPVEAPESAEPAVTIGQAAAFSLSAITDRAGIHPNVVEMHDAIDRWVAEANERGGQAGIDYLALGTKRIEANFQALADGAASDSDMPAHLVGVTVGDLDAAHLRVNRAVDALREEMRS